MAAFDSDAEKRVLASMSLHLAFRGGQRRPLATRPPPPPAAAGPAAGQAYPLNMRRIYRELLRSPAVFSCACSLTRPHCSGCPLPSPHLKALGSATQGHARGRDSRAALGNPQDKRHIRQTYSGRSARVNDTLREY